MVHIKIIDFNVMWKPTDFNRKKKSTALLCVEFL